MINLTKTPRPTVRSKISLVKKPQRTLTQHDLLEMLSSLDRRATFVSVVMDTEPQLVGGKSSPFHGRVKKISKMSCIINFSYENSVNNQRGREGIETLFEAAPRKWGARVVGTPLVRHKDQYYLEVKVEKVLSSFFLVDGMPRDRSELEGAIRQGGEGRQGVDNPVILRDVSLLNIREITIGGVHYNIKKG